MESQEAAEQKQEKEQEKTAPDTEEGKQETVTYTQEQVAKMQSTFEQKWRTAETRAEKAERNFQDAVDRVTDLEERYKKLEDEMDEKTLGSSDGYDEKDARNLMDLRRQLRDEKLKLDRERRDVEKTKAEVNEALKYTDANKIAKEHDIDVEPLMECKTYNEMLVKAKDMVIEKLKSPPKKEEKKEEETKTHFDSGKSTSGGGQKVWKASEVRAMSSEDRMKYRKEILDARNEGRFNYTE